MFPFQLPWDDASESATNISWLNDKPAGRDGFVHVKDGHFFAGEKRLRIFGVNTCFAANFPDKAMAPKVAARMAKFGINCVRFHHMDMMSAPGGIFAKDGRTLDPGQLDRLDFFIAELKKNGIYAGLHLHVSRTYPDRPRAEKKGNPDYDKGVDNYCAAMIAMQKDYARDLLTHVNAYTGKRYADEPAVALVEVNNENAFGFQWWAGQMDDLPNPYREELESLWAAWILKKHGSDEAARKAWSEGAREPGAEMLADPSWSFEQHGGASQSHSVENGLITLIVRNPGTESWHVQFSTSPLAVKAGSYEVRFRWRASESGVDIKDANLSVALMQSHEPWKVLGSANVKSRVPFHEASATIQITEADDKARLTFGGMGKTPGVFEFSGLKQFTGISLRPAGVDGTLTRDEKSRIPIIRKRDLARTTPAKQRDWQEFIWDTETAYWNGMRDFLKKDLGVKAPIVGTQGFWSPGHVQVGMDVIDSHAYWQHPDFHGKGWNPDVWDVKNEPMAGAPDGGTLPGLAAQRVAGKPFLCTEYNHPAPNTYSAETFPLLCAFAALQDWDGVFAFSYSHRAGDAWSQEHFDNFFDIDRHPVKMATLPGAVISFRRGDLEQLLYIREIEIGRTISWLKILNRGPGMGGPSTFFDPLVAMNSSVGIRPIPQERDKEVYLGAVDEERGFLGPHFSAIMHRRNGEGIVWNTGKHSVTADAPRLRLAVGRFNPGESSKIDDVTIVSGAMRQAWACFQFSVLDRDSTFRTGFSAARLPNFATAKRILITATGDIENTGMGWKNAAKTSVGRDWGKAPVLVEGPAAKIELPGGGKFKAWALDERGQRRAKIPVANGTLEIGPQHRTLWYEVERQ